MLNAREDEVTARAFPRRADGWSDGASTTAASVTADGRRHQARRRPCDRHEELGACGGRLLVRFATPPSTKRVIEETSMWNERATSAWANSWHDRGKKRTAVIAATVSTFVSDQKGSSRGRRRELNEYEPEDQRHEA